jgi:hypothetical protein
MNKIMSIFATIILVLSLISYTKVNDNSSAADNLNDKKSGVMIDISSDTSQQK